MVLLLSRPSVLWGSLGIGKPFQSEKWKDDAEMTILYSQSIYLVVSFMITYVCSTLGQRPPLCQMKEGCLETAQVYLHNGLIVLFVQGENIEEYPVSF